MKLYWFILNESYETSLGGVVQGVGFGDLTTKNWFSLCGNDENTSGDCLKLIFINKIIKKLAILNKYFIFFKVVGVRSSVGRAVDS